MRIVRTVEMKLESRVRSHARRVGYRVCKSRRQLSLDNFGEFMLVDASTNFVVLGSHCDTSLEDIEEFLSA